MIYMFLNVNTISVSYYLHRAGLLSVNGMPAQVAKMNLEIYNYEVPYYLYIWSPAYMIALRIDII